MCGRETQARNSRFHGVIMSGCEAFTVGVRRLCAECRDRIGGAVGEGETMTRGWLFMLCAGCAKLPPADPVIERHPLRPWASLELLQSYMVGRFDSSAQSKTDAAPTSRWRCARCSGTARSAASTSSRR